MLAFYGLLNLHVALNTPGSSIRMQDLGPKLHLCTVAVVGLGPGLQPSAELQSQSFARTSSGARLLQSLWYGKDGRLLPAASPMSPFPRKGKVVQSVSG